MNYGFSGYVYSTKYRFSRISKNLRDALLNLRKRSVPRFGEDVDKERRENPSFLTGAYMGCRPQLHLRGGKLISLQGALCPVSKKEL